MRVVRAIEFTPDGGVMLTYQTLPDDAGPGQWAAAAQLFAPETKDTADAIEDLQDEAKRALKFLLRLRDQLPPDELGDEPEDEDEDEDEPGYDNPAERERVR